MPSYLDLLMSPTRTPKYIVYAVDSTVAVTSYRRKADAERKAAKINEAEARYPNPSFYAVAEVLEYEFEVVHWVRRRNLRTGAFYFELSNTPLSCSPSSETYWSM